MEGFKASSRSTSAKIKLWVNHSGGAVKKSITVKNGDDLAKLSNGRDTYKEGFIVNDINIGEGYIEFANDMRVRLNCLISSHTSKSGRRCQNPPLPRSC